MKQIIAWQCTDGTLFTNEAEARDHENKSVVMLDKEGRITTDWDAAYGLIFTDVAATEGFLNDLFDNNADAAEGLPNPNVDEINPYDMGYWLWDGCYEHWIQIGEQELTLIKAFQDHKLLTLGE